MLRPLYIPTFVCFVIALASTAVVIETAAQPESTESWRDIDEMHRGEADEAPSFLEASRLKVHIGTGVWLPRLTGDVTLRGGGRLPGPDLASDLQLNSSEPTFRAELEVEYDAWRLRAFVLDFSTDGSGPSEKRFQFGDLRVRAGETIRSRYDRIALGVEFGYEIGLLDRDGLTLNIVPTAGVRYVDIDLAIDAILQPGSPGESASLRTIGVLGGGRLTANWQNRFVVGIGGNIGTTARGGLIITAESDITWLPGEGNIGLTLGYRLMRLYDVEESDLNFDSSLAGLFLAVSIYF